MPPSHSVLRIAPLDGLRGILALLVVMNHSAINLRFNLTGTWESAPIYFFARCGPVAVYLFFLTSGFVLWWQMIQAPRKISYPKFLMSRWRRLGPAYLVVFCTVVLLSFCFTGFALNETPASFAEATFRWLTFGVPNGNFPNFNGYPHTGTLMAHVFWTLRWEWLFYLVLPALQIYVSGNRIWTLLCSAVGIHLALWNQWNIPQVLILLQGFLPVFLKSFFPGMMTAFIKSKASDLSWTQHPIFGAISLALLYTALFVPLPLYGDLGEWVDKAMLVAIFVPIAFGATYFGFLTSRPIQYLGKISYSLYLWHGVVLFSFSRICEKWIPFDTMSLSQLCVFMTTSSICIFAISALSYEWVEKPWTKSQPRESLPTPARAAA